MGNITDQINTAFRDFITDGVASSGAHEVIKSEVRAIGPLIESALGTIGLGALVDVLKSTKSLLNADLAHAADTIALVYGDSTDANNDLYIKVGGSGSGSWTNTGALHSAVEGVAQPLIDAGVATAVSSVSSVSDTVQVGLGLGAAAVRLLESAGSITPTCFRAFTHASATTYEFVAVARAQGTRRVLQLINSLIGLALDFDLVAATVTPSAGTTNTATGFIRDIGGGFYECRAVFTTSGSASTNWQARPSPAGVFPFTGSTSDGLWVKSLVLRVQGTTTNLFPSSDPANAAFTKTSLTATAGNVPEQRTTERVASLEAASSAINATVNGAMTGTRMTEGSGSGLSVRAFRSVAIPSGNNYRLQFQAKAGQRTIIRSFSQTGLSHTASFNLLSGVATVVSGSGTASMTRLHNGWWECIYEAVSTDSAAQNWQVQIASASGTWPYTGDGTSGLFLNRARVTNLTTGIVLLDTTTWTSMWTLTSATMTAAEALFGGILPENMGSGATTHPLSGRRVVVLGTSLEEQAQWTVPFASLTGCTLVNLGVSGSSYGLSSGYGDSLIGQATAQMTTGNIASDTALVIAGAPVNDPFWRVPLGAITDTSTSTFAGAMANLSVWMAANRANARLVYLQLPSAEPTYPTHRHGGTASGGLAVVAQLEEYQEMLRRVAQREGRALIDLNNAGLSWRRSGIRSDGLHWNATGGGLVAQIVSEQMRRIAVTGWL
jgi:lysophospholipase L1-like esterase